MLLLFVVGGDAVLQGFAGQIDDIVHAEFVHNMCPVILNGANGAFKTVSDSFVALTGEDFPEDIHLRFSQDFCRGDINHHPFNRVVFGKNFCCE